MKCKEKNKDRCSCTYTSCSNWGVCCDCIAKHRSRNEMPACYFSKEAEASYDRSVENFINDYQSR